MSNLAKKLNESVSKVVEANTLQKFERALVMADVINELRDALTDNNMKSLMGLQGSKLGFVTDKDREGGYKMPVVRDCLIEATLRGLEPCGNQFNIIAGNMYVTKEGFKYLLDKVPGLTWKISNELPRMNETSAAVVMKVKWKMNGGEWQEEKLDVAVKVNKFMGTDAVIGKAERKSRAWLYNNFTVDEIVDGDAEDVTIELTEVKKDAVEKKATKAESELEEALKPKTAPKEPKADGEINFG